MITSISQLDLSKKYTYADYLTWQFEEVVELIRGKIFRMSPAPSPAHQWMSAELHYQIMDYLRDKKATCKAFAAPFDVRLPLPPQQQTPEKIDTVVQPDISIVCDLSKIDQQGCQGPPDWIIEILSKGTASKDLTEKYNLYEHAGVREYWIVHPDEQTIIPYRLDSEGTYQLLRKTPFVYPEKVPVGVLEGFAMDLGELFGGD